MSRTPTKPYIVGIGGTTSPGSSTESALLLALDAAARSGAETRLFDGAALVRLPHYGSVPLADLPEAGELLAAVRRADGLVLASPGYHGSISGLFKNVVDYLEETSRDARPYLHGLPVGLIATAYGWQATGTTLMALRSMVHALRGWPTPFGAGINASGGLFKAGVCTDPSVAAQLDIVGQQVVELALLKQMACAALDTDGQ